MKESRAWSILAIVMLMACIIFIGSTVVKLWVRDWWFLCHLLAAAFFFGWAKGLHELGEKALAKEMKLPSMPKAQEKASLQLSDQLRSFRDSR